MSDFERNDMEPLGDDMDPDMEEGLEPFMLTDEDGREHPFEMLGDIEFEGAQYAIMSPLEEDENFSDLGDDAQPVVVLRMMEEEGSEDFVLESVMDDALLDRVFDAFVKAHPEIFEDEE